MSMRKALPVYSRKVTTDETNQADAVYTGRRVRHLRPPWVLTCEASAAGTTAPGTTSILMTMNLQDSADGTTWADVAGFTTVTVTAVSTTGRRANANQIREFVRVLSDSSHATWASGLTITGTLTGDSGIS